MSPCHPFILLSKPCVLRFIASTFLLAFIFVPSLPAQTNAPARLSAPEPVYLGPLWSVKNTSGLNITQLVDSYTLAAATPTQTVFSANQASAVIPPAPPCVGSLASLISSPYADSLYKIFGRPSVRQGVLADTTDGEYAPGTHTATLNQSLGQCSQQNRARVVLTHELAHAFQATAGDFLGDIWFEAHIPAPALNLANYASISRSEHQAEAFTAAIGLLGFWQSPRLGEATKLLWAAQLDQTAPGTIMLARRLLTHKVYASHSLNLHPLAGFTPIKTNWPRVRPLSPPLRSLLRNAAFTYNQESPAWRQKLKLMRLKFPASPAP